MKYAHQVKISVFENKDSDIELLLEPTLEKFTSLKLEKILTKKIALGFNDKKIQTYTVTITKNSEINIFLKFLMKNLTIEQKQILLKQLETRLDQDLHFFIRFDKDKLLENKYFLTDSGNCFHIEITIAAFPKKREIAIKIVKNILEL